MDRWIGKGTHCAILSLNNRRYVRLKVHVICIQKKSCTDGGNPYIEYSRKYLIYGETLLNNLIVTLLNESSASVYGTLYTPTTNCLYFLKCQKRQTAQVDFFNVSCDCITSLS